MSLPTTSHCATEKHPNFKPSMLAPPKPKFKPVTLEGGPIVKEHSRRNTGLETKRPHQWGPSAATTEDLAPRHVL